MVDLLLKFGARDDDCKALAATVLNRDETLTAKLLSVKVIALHLYISVLFKAFNFMCFLLLECRPIIYTNSNCERYLAKQISDKTGQENIDNTSAVHI